MDYFANYRIRYRVSERFSDGHWGMRLTVWVILLSVTAVFAHYAYAQEKAPLTSGSRMKVGIAAYSIGEYDLAIFSFQQAVVLDPSNAQAQFYLGSAYAREIVPNRDTPENRETAKHAIDSLNKTLQLKPNDGLAMRELVWVYENSMAKDDAIKVLLTILSITPTDFEAEYEIGVLDSGKAREAVFAVLRKDPVAAQQLDYPKASASSCREIAAQNATTLADAEKHLQRALELDASYSDAMVYLGVVHQQKAGTRCTDGAARAADMAKAKEYLSHGWAMSKSADTAPCPYPPSSLTPLAGELDLLSPPPAPPQPPPPPPAPHRPAKAGDLGVMGLPPGSLERNFYHGKVRT
jgi:tetratricopeptide (TPR) repeat protein